MVRVGESKALHAGAGVVLKLIQTSPMTDSPLCSDSCWPTWQAIEQNLSRDTMRIYDLPVQQVLGCYHHVRVSSGG